MSFVEETIDSLVSTAPWNWSSTFSPVTTAPQSSHGTEDCSSFANFVTNSLIAGFLCLLGFVGNSMSFIVLMMDEDSRVAAFSLQALAFTDNFFLAAWFLHFTIQDAFSYFHLIPTFHVAWYYVRMYTYPLLFIGQTGTIWLTVLIAASRYIAVCHPYNAPRYCSLPVVKKCVVGVALFSVIYNLPRYFEVNIRPIPSIANMTNECRSFYLGYTTFGNSWFYRTIYFHVLYIITSFVLPLAFLLFLNTRLTLAYRVVQRRRNNMHMRHEHHDQSITLVMIMVVLLFIICNAPARVVQMTWQYNTQPCPTSAFILVAISNVMEVLNSSSNFIIYCVFRRQFRLNLLHRICRFVGDRRPNNAPNPTNGMSTRDTEANGTLLITTSTYLLKEVNHDAKISTKCPADVSKV